MTDLSARPKRQEVYDHRYVIIGEGHAEMCLLSALQRHATAGGDPRLEERFNVVRCAHGKDTFRARLIEMKEQANFPDLPGIVLVTDADDDDKASFRVVAAQVSAVTRHDGRKLRAPGASWVLGPKPADMPPVAILTIPPGATHGTLESLLLLPLGAAWPEELIAVRKLHVNLGNRYEGQIGRRAKSEAACMVAVCCREDPATSIANLWQDGKKMSHLLANSHFDPIRSFLLSLPWTSVAAPVPPLEPPQSAGSSQPSSLVGWACSAGSRVAAFGRRFLPRRK